MKTSPVKLPGDPGAGPRPPEGFSLIEILVAMLLLSVITLGLLAMFHQTQRAFRGSIHQVDVLENGRAAAEMLARELEQMTPSHQPDLVAGNNSNLRIRCTNFFAELSPGFDNPQLLGLPGTTWAGNNSMENRRTNIVQRFFFLTRLNQDWIGTGYLVVPETDAGMAGTLYRYSVTNFPRNGWIRLSDYFNANCLAALAAAANGLPVTNMNRIAEGVAHLQLRAYDRQGILINPSWPNPLAPQARPNFVSLWMNFANWNQHTPDQVNVYFLSNAVPASVELELGLIEPQILQRLKSIGVAAARGNYLSNHAAQVHLFRQRVPIRNVDITAF